MRQHLLIRAYFRQADLYHSDSKQDMLPIKGMAAPHAANAAERLVRDADFWAKEAGVDTRHPVLWMSQQPLWRALLDSSGQ
jgi:hypothetical protein